jgi:hypothetical protein
MVLHEEIWFSMSNDELFQRLARAILVHAVRGAEGLDAGSLYAVSPKRMHKFRIRTLRKRSRFPTIGLAPSS